MGLLRSDSKGWSLVKAFLTTAMVSRITRTWISVETNETKLIRRLSLNHICFNHFPKKVCWKKFFHFQFGLLFFDICCLFWQNGAWPPVVGAWRRTRQQNKCQKKVEIKSWITFSMVVFRKNGNIKHDSA